MFLFPFTGPVQIEAQTLTFPLSQNGKCSTVALYSCALPDFLLLKKFS